MVTDENATFDIVCDLEWAVRSVTWKWIDRDYCTSMGSNVELNWSDYEPLWTDPDTEYRQAVRDKFDISACFPSFGIPRKMKLHTHTLQLHIFSGIFQMTDRWKLSYEEQSGSLGFVVLPIMELVAFNLLVGLIPKSYCTEV